MKFRLLPIWFFDEMHGGIGVVGCWIGSLSFRAESPCPSWRDTVQMTGDCYPGFQGRLIVVEKLDIGHVVRYRGMIWWNYGMGNDMVVMCCENLSTEGTRSCPG